MIPRADKSALWYWSLTIFALSGCAGLIYQSIWAQYLGLFLGHAAYAQSLVLAIFMGGMALGAWWASTRPLYWRSLLRAYALVELFVGLAALAFHPEYLAVTEFAYDVVLPAATNDWVAEVFKCGSSILLVLPQATLLGATFPLFASGLMRRLPTRKGSVLSGLYFANSIGAAVGTLAATFILLPAAGMPGAMRFAALLNIIAAAVAFVLARGDSRGEPVARSSTAQDPVPAFLLGAALVTGLTSFVYEIGWVRMLSLVLGATMHAFELMLAAFIGGLAFGAFWIRRRIDAYASPIRVAGYVQILMGAAALASLLLYDRSFDWIAWFIGALSKTKQGYALFNLVTMSTAILIMAPTAFFAGMTLPLFTLALIRNGGGESSVGRIYAANTIGAIIGVFAAVHLLLPMLGLKLAMVAAAAADLALGIALLRHMLEPGRTKVYLVTVAGCGAALGITLLFARFDPLAMASGVYRSGVARLSRDHARVHFYRDGKTASVASFVADDGTASIATNGKVDASIQLNHARAPSVDEITMVMLAALPLALHPDARSVAVIGFGSGLSTHTLLGDPRLKRVDTIEIEPAMFDAAKIFGYHVERAYNDPRSHVHFNDARTFFATNQSRYDIIISEPSNPWVSGVANLFSREFYEFVPRHLNPDGLLVQWVQQYEITDELVASVVRALSASFSDFEVYLSDNSDMLILARTKGSFSSVDSQIFHEPRLQSLLERVGIPSADDLAIHRIGNRATLMPLFDALSERSNSDFFPILSLEAPSARFQRIGARAILELTVADLPVLEVLSGVAPVDPATTGINPYYTPTLFSHEALDIANELSGAATLAQGSDPGVQGRIPFVRATVGQCQGVADGIAQVDALILIAGRTIPFLSSGRLRGVWSEPAWIGCATQIDVVRATLALLDAMAQRKFDAVRSSAIALLSKHGGQMSPKAREWLLRAAMLAAIAQHDYGAVGNIDTSLGKNIAPLQATEVQRAYLLAFADAHAKLQGAR